MSHPRGRRWEAFVRSVIDAYGGVCHICLLLHGGARQADHLEPVTENPAAAWSRANTRAAHGAPGNPCKTCSAAAGRRVFCNQLRGYGSVERARRIIAEKIAEHGGGSTGNGTPRDTGRPW